MSPYRLISSVVWVLCVAAGVTAQQEPAGSSRPDRPRIGLVLSGGGARGAAHVGVIRVLEELRIPIHAIAGNSMGALVGGTYAYGLSPDQMEKVLTGIDWPLMLSDAPRRSMIPFRRKQDDLNLLFDLTFGFRDWQLLLPRGLVQGHYTRNTLKVMTSEALGEQSFDALPIPFRAVAADIGTGDEVVLDSGLLAEAMAASMSIPGVFNPVEIDGRSLVDGMVVNNIPIDVAKAMGVDVVIAVDIGTPILDPDQIKTLLDVTGQMVSILMQKNVDERLALLTEDDALVRPDLGDMSSTDFGRAADAIAIGAAAARDMADELRRYSVSEADYAEFLQRHRRPALPAPTIRHIKITNDSGLGENVIRARMQTATGEALDLERLEADLDRIHGLEAFERVTFEIEPVERDTIDLRIVCIARTWGPNYIRFGLSIQDNFKGDSAYRFGINYTMRNLNRLGGELRTDAQVGQEIGLATEFYQPLDSANRFFIAPGCRWADLPVNVFQNGGRVADADVELGQIGLDLGANFSDWAELRIGIRRVAGDVDYTLAAIPLTSSSFDDAVFRVGLEIDTLDEAGFPTSGTRAGIEYLNSDTSLGADADYQRIQVGGARAMSWDPATLILIGRYASAFDGTTLPVYQRAAAGGLFNISGFEPGQLSGQHSLFAAAVGFVQVGGSRRQLLGLPVYLGATLEAGRVTSRRTDLFDSPILAGSVWLGVDSPVGPVYLAYGHAEGGNGSAYLFVGRSF